MGPFKYHPSGKAIKGGRKKLPSSSELHPQVATVQSWNIVRKLVKWVLRLIPLSPGLSYEVKCPKVGISLPKQICQEEHGHRLCSGGREGQAGQHHLERMWLGEP